MTIAEKWQLMMSSFADIEAAILEMDGAVGGGYANYAKGVRSIYSTDAYKPEYTYPAKSLLQGQYINSLLAFCACVKEEIRQAIIDGGVECDESVPLSEYGNKIREINVAPQIVTRPYTTVGCFDEPCNYKLEASGGKPPYTWSSDLWWMLGTRLNPDGTITGTPTFACTGNNRITVTDAAGKSVTVDFSLRVDTKTVSVYRVGADTFVYDGQEHTLNLVCEEYPDMELQVQYRRSYSEPSTRHPTEVGYYSVSIFVVDDRYKYNCKVGNERSFRLTIKEATT